MRHQKLIVDMKDKFIINLIGWAGAFFILVAYFSLSFELLQSKGVVYNTMNLAGGLLLAYRVWTDKNYSSLILEIAFILIALKSLIV